MGIPAEAGSVEFSWHLWWVVNRSRKRRLLLESASGASQQRLIAVARVGLGADAEASLTAATLHDRYVLGPPWRRGRRASLYRVTVDSGAVLDVAVKMLHPDHWARMAEWHRRWNEQVKLLRSLQASGVMAVRDGFIGPLPHAPGTGRSRGTDHVVLGHELGGRRAPRRAWAAAHDEASPAIGRDGVADAIGLVLTDGDEHGKG